MTHIIYGLMLWAIAFIATPAAASSPNHCEAIIVEITQAVEDGYLSQNRADKIIERCSDELWGD